MGDYADSAVRYFCRPRKDKKDRRPPTVVTCKYCGEGNLRWGNRKGGAWQVRDINGAIHLCKMV